MKVSVDGGILAGGLSTRMGGLDKGLLEYKGQAMTGWVFSALLPHVDTLYINCNQNYSLYRNFSPNICSDNPTGYHGPLAGLASLMESSSADYLLISPCDTPMLSNKFGSRMLEKLNKLIAEEKSHLLLVAKDTQQKHPLHLCISCKYKDDIKKALDRGDRKVIQWIESHQPHWVDFSDDSEQFSNFNTKFELGISEQPPTPS